MPFLALDLCDITLTFFLIADIQVLNFLTIMVLVSIISLLILTFFVCFFKQLLILVIVMLFKTWSWRYIHRGTAVWEMNEKMLGYLSWSPIIFGEKE